MATMVHVYGTNWPARWTECIFTEEAKKVVAMESLGYKSFIIISSIGYPQVSSFLTNRHNHVKDDNQTF